MRCTMALLALSASRRPEPSARRTVCSGGAEHQSSDQPAQNWHALSSGNVSPSSSARRFPMRNTKEATTVAA